MNAPKCIRRLPLGLGFGLGLFGFGSYSPPATRRRGEILKSDPIIRVTRPSGHVPRPDRARYCVA